MILIRATVAALLIAIAAPVVAQTVPGVPTPAETPAPATPSSITAKPAVTSDADIAARIRSIFGEITALRAVRVRASAGVVTLSGTVPAPGDVDRAGAIAGRVAGVVTVQNDVARDLKLDSNLTPVLSKFTDDMTGLVRALPLIGVALGLALLIGYLGHLIASIDWLWRRISPNVFLAELIATMIRAAFIMLGAVAGLEVLGATALLGAVLGGAGVIGIAIGFAVRDTVDNYVSSLMLSLRQPFRANDHVVIEGSEGRVVRLTSRATILMTLDGNHLRIPNSTVFKAVILNYTRNPERRFDFDLGVDADDDPIDGMAVGLAAVRGLEFVLDEPTATANRRSGRSRVPTDRRGDAIARRSSTCSHSIARVSASMMATSFPGLRGMSPKPVVPLRKSPCTHAIACSAIESAWVREQERNVRSQRSPGKRCASRLTIPSGEGSKITAP